MPPFYKNNLLNKALPGFILLVSLLLTYLSAYSQLDTANLAINTSNNRIINNSSTLIDEAGNFNEQNILTADADWWENKDVPVFQVTNVNIWMRFTITNTLTQPVKFLEIQYANISEMEIFKLTNGQLIKIKNAGNNIAFTPANSADPNFVLPTGLSNNESGTYYIKAYSHHPLLLPIFKQDESSLKKSSDFQTIIVGIYLGIVIAFFFYNLFLFVFTLDRSYLYYILFLLFLGLAQLALAGYTFKYLWPGSPGFNRYAVVLFTGLAGISGIVFGMVFLQVRKYIPKLTWIYYILICFYAVSIILSFSGYNFISYQILNYNGLLAGFSLLVLSWYIARKGYRPAYFYFVAWIAFLLGLMILGLRNLNVLPYNNFTTYILYVGSAIEAILLSIALADKISILRKEKEKSQAEALRISLENEKLVKEQNIDLEIKVLERTEALQSTNNKLNEAIVDLKDAQIQLVESEKMASLGQLTAGIAHEINNPINFVKSNIKPLQLDINDLFEVIDEYQKLHHTDMEVIGSELNKIDGMSKAIDMEFVRTEIYSLMKGIEDGADRTAEIVRGLRNFSRLDESNLKTVNVHEGIESTLIILRNSIPENIEIIREFTADGEIECFPGKLNQVFMNILSNALQAIKSKKDKFAQEKLIIKTRDLETGEIEICIEDTGPGMTEKVKNKIFDPFFTTKEVGEGTGLGLAIVFRIIQEHQGRIEVLSQPGKGSTFILTLLRTIPMKSTI